LLKRIRKGGGKKGVEDAEKGRPENGETVPVGGNRIRFPWENQ